MRIMKNSGIMENEKMETSEIKLTSGKIVDQ